MVKLGRVESEAVGDVRGVGALDGLAQARHHGVDLLREVVVEVQLEAAVLGGDFVGVVGAVGESLAAGALVHGATAGDLLGGGVCLEGDDVRDGFALVDALSLPRGSQPQRHLHVRLVGGVWVILRPLRELLGDDELVHRHRAVHQVLPALAKRLVDSLDDVLGGVSGENLLQREVTLLLRQGGPIAADDVETLLLNHRGVAAVWELLDHEGGVLLLLQEQHGLVKAVHLNLQNLEALVGQLLELLRHVHNLRNVRRLGVDHDRVGVAVDDVPAQVTLREVHGGLKDLAPLQGDQLRQGLGVESRRGETEAAVHGVCGELERHLANVELLGPRRVALRLDHVLHLAPAIHQLLDHLREHNLGAVGIRGQRRRGGSRGGIVGIRLGLRDGGEADVILLDDGRVQRVEVHHQHVLVVEALLGLQDQAARVRRAAALLASLDAAVAVEIAAVQIGVGVLVPATKLAFLGGELIGQEVLARVELVQEEVLDALRAGVLQRLGPEVTRDVGELPRERKHREVKHQTERQPRVRLGGLGEAHQRRRVGKLARDVRRGHLHAVPPELVLRERREGVGNLLDEIASGEIRVGE